MVSVILKKTGTHYARPSSDNDYVVLYDGQVVGRIMRHPRAPEDRPWFWTVTALGDPPSSNYGYSTSREKAITDFRLQWATKSKIKNKSNDMAALIKGARDLRHS